MANKQLKGNGWFVPNSKDADGNIVKGDTIYLRGKKGKRISSKMKATKANIAWINKPGNAQDKYEEITGTKKVVKEGMMFEEYALKRISAPSITRSESQQSNRLGKLKNHILPFFEKYRLSDIMIEDIEAWQVSMHNKALSTSTIRQCESIMGEILKFARGNLLIQSNPMDLTNRTKYVPQKQGIEYYSKEEVRAILMGSTGMMQAFAYIAFTLGVRTGEVLGLRWEDIDFENGIITFRRTMSKQLKASREELERLQKNGMRIVIGKSRAEQKAQRPIMMTEITGVTKKHDGISVMPDVTKRVLETYFKHRPDNDWLFVNRLGKPYTNSRSVVDYKFKPLLKKLGIEYKDLYQSRHSYHTLLNAADVSEGFLKAQARHGENSTVLRDHYIHEERGIKEKWGSDIESANNVFTALLAGEN